ncbi:hypothetical protein FQN54_002163 [Arachnomyces sp. PD_36]|nr:hypothetical protein FQN54_002163 [Arachnomyces sp. PD_36]
MATQAAMIADTIVGMKKALKREADHSGPDDLITQPTNRGNKLRADAKYVHEGALGFSNSREHYKEKIEHAGYSRYILKRNPPRYDSDGDELDDDDADEAADAATAEENPFSGVVLEKLLCPLKHPSELATHPSMAHAYTSQALEKLVEAVKNKLHQERILLWRAKNLHSQFLGDSTWMPCGDVEAPDDHFIFEPRRLANNYSQSNSSYHTGSAKNTANERMLTGDPSEKSYGESQNNVPPTEDVEMTDAPAQDEATQEETQDDKPQEETKTEDSLVAASNNPQKGHRSVSAPAEDLNANKLEASSRKHSVQSTSALGEQSSKPDGSIERIDRNKNNPQDPNADEDKNDDEEEQQHSGNGSPAPPRRMTTRAQTQTNQPPNTTTNPSSRAPSPSYTADDSTSTPSTSLYTPHPLFTLSSYSRPDRNFGLPASEADETRRLLWSYVQKQEETVRSFARLLDSLLKAHRMKQDVWEWCKAEGHVGEMSDGEDWYDKEKWGLGEGEELKKGIHEPDDDGPQEEGRGAAKRGRGRRQ